MKSIFLVKYGSPEEAFEVREASLPALANHEVLIKVEAFGLNFADVLSRNGAYRDAPRLPCVLGFEVVGRIEKTGSDVKNLFVGERVIAFTRFGGYAEFAKADARVCASIPEEMPNGFAAALATQYCTAYYCACEMVHLYEGDHVLIHAAAGGVGTALIQLAKRRGCIVYGTVGSDKKFDYIKTQGADHPINYRKTDFVDAVRKIRGKEGIDVIFDSVGGRTYRKSRKILSQCGRLVHFGIAERVNARLGILSDLNLALHFGFLHPILLLLKSQGMIGVSMRRVADFKPHTLQRCLRNVAELAATGEIKPHVGGVFNAGQTSQAHRLLESRESLGKIVVEWR